MIPVFVFMLSASLCAGAETGDGKADVEGNNHLRYVLNMDVEYPTLGDAKIDAALRLVFQENQRRNGDFRFVVRETCFGFSEEDAPEWLYGTAGTLHRLPVGHTVPVGASYVATSNRWLSGSTRKGVISSSVFPTPMTGSSSRSSLATIQAVT